MKQNDYVQVKVVVMSTLYLNTLLDFPTYELVMFYLDHIHIVVQILVVYQVQVIRHHICGLFFHRYGNNNVQGPTCDFN